MSTADPPPSTNPMVARPQALKLNHSLSSGFESLYPLLAPRGARSGDGQHMNYSVVVIVVVLSVVFILSGFLHLLARCLGRRRRHLIAPQQHRPLVSALHGQLQHLFHLHDGGVEQGFINTLPVFAYGSIRGLKDSADCAVCLNEFGDDDRLRLLPKCKHAFHLECIDTWLLSHSTCPLCRRSLLPDHPLASSSSQHRHCELADTETATEMATSASDMIHSNRLPCPDSAEHQLTDSRSSRRTTNSLHGSYHNSFRIIDALPSDRDSENEIQEIQELQEIQEIQHIEALIEAAMNDLQMNSTPSPPAPTIRVMHEDGTERVLKVELGKVAACRAVALQADSRKLTKNGARSYSMGSYEYIVDPTSWKLTIAPTPFPGRSHQDCKPSHRSALSDTTPDTTPATEERFWTSRGLFAPHSLSRFRELLTPIMSSDSNAGSSPFGLDHSSYSPGQGGDRWIDIDIERGEVIETAPNSEPARFSTTSSSSPSSSSPEGARAESFKQRSSSLGRLGLPEGFEKFENVSCFRRSLSEALAGRETVAINFGSKDFVGKDVDDGNSLAWDASVKPGSASRKFSLHWLMGRDKRIVFSAASPSPLPLTI